MLKLGKTLGQLRREKNWDIGQARTCLVCGEVFLNRKNLRIHRAKHRNMFATTKEVICEKTVTT